MKKEKTTVSHKIFTVIGIILCVLLVPMLIMNVTLIVKSYVNPDKVPDVGGYMPMIVLTESMHPTIKGGDLIIIKSAEPEQIKVDDVITYFDPDSSKQSTTTHRVIDIKTVDGKLMFETKGDANPATDGDIPAEKLVGVYQLRIAGMGKVAMFMQTTPGLIVCVVVPLLLLVGYDVLRRRKYEKSKQSDTDALLAELEALKAMAAAKTEGGSEQETADSENSSENTEE